MTIFTSLYIHNKYIVYIVKFPLIGICNSFFFFLLSFTNFRYKRTTNDRNNICKRNIIVLKKFRDTQEKDTFDIFTVYSSIILQYVCT